MGGKKNPQEGGGNIEGMKSRFPQKRRFCPKKRRFLPQKKEKKKRRRKRKQNSNLTRVSYKKELSEKKSTKY